MTIGGDQDDQYNFNSTTKIFLKPNLDNPKKN